MVARVAAAVLVCSAVSSACGAGAPATREAAHSERVATVVESAAEAHGGPVAVLVVDNRTGAATVTATAGDAAAAPLEGGARPAASLAKIVVLAAALESGVAPYETLNVPQCIPAEREMICTRISGEMSLTEATARSNNPAFIVLAERTGVDAVADLGTGVGMALEPSRWLPLGRDAVAMESVAAFFVALANDGETLAVTGPDGSELVGSSGRLVSAETARATRKLLRAVVTDGTGRLADGAEEPYGKTGTADGRTDAWFAGVSGQRTVVVWAGAAEGARTSDALTAEPSEGILADYEELLARDADEPHSGPRLTGGGLPARVFRQVADLLAEPAPGA